MSGQIIDGKKIAQGVLIDLAAHAEDMRERQGGIVPGLAVILVGDDPASLVYVRNKNRACEEVGFRSYAHHLPETTTEDELLELIADLNANPQVNGILVQLPLPPHISGRRVINAISPLKDVDGFHPVNVGRHVGGLLGLKPCTPLGCMHLLRTVMPDTAGKRALVVGRSNIVGKPMAIMLLDANCTVTIAHSQTVDLAFECSRADILVTALGKPEFIKGTWIKRGAVVLDVGINRVTERGTGKVSLVGDVEFDEALNRAAYITPVPGGVGPMTIACLLQNTMMATMIQNGWG